MSHLKPGDAAPDFSLHDQHGQMRHLRDFRGRWLVLYAYPRDLTPGCSVEAVDFTALHGEFARLNAEVLGLSPDTVKKHQSFCEKKDLVHTLLADPEHQTIAAYGAWQLKKFMGKESMGVVRSTWLIDAEGSVRQVWSPVSVKGHASEVLEALKRSIARG